KLLYRPVICNEHSTAALLRDVSEVPENEPELVLCCKPLKAEKPKRRLMPASSILLKSISGLDIEDENEKPKGPRGEKKVAAVKTNRSQGSTSLRRLLMDNYRR
ncbi:hypothetical protein RJ639_016739, partial [Escallonia herrerae]